jgi:protein required for attachment to host cells
MIIHRPGSKVASVRDAWPKPQDPSDAVESADWHEIEEHRFARKVAATTEQVIRTGKATAMVVVAPPRTLAELREAFHPDVRACVIAEINKDLTKHPVGEIEKQITGLPGDA